MTKESVKGRKAGSCVFVSNSCVVENQHLDSAGGVAFRETLQMFGMFGVWLKGNRTNLLEDENRSKLNISARIILFAWFFLSSGSPKYFV